MYDTPYLNFMKKMLKSVYIYGSYRKIKTGVSLFWTALYKTGRSGCYYG